mmetsp:Transcript_63854/g.100958  ORF Transcript_63854/g.100958 Transcript_63854/m.100958 type:complete len:98 (-) Transcript_63854:72-365(-)
MQFPRLVYDAWRLVAQGNFHTSDAGFHGLWCISIAILMLSTAWVIVERLLWRFLHRTNLYLNKRHVEGFLSLCTVVWASSHIMHQSIVKGQFSLSNS